MEVYDFYSLLNIIMVMGLVGMWHACGRTEMPAGLLWINLKESDHLEEAY